MKISVSSMVPEAMVSLRKKIQAWRINKQQRRMPKELWDEAVRLAREYGVHPVSRNVEVSYTRLKKLVDGGRSTVGVPRFAEVAPARRFCGGAQIEIIRPDGCKMSVQNADAQTAQQITSTFLQ